MVANGQIMRQESQGELMASHPALAASANGGTAMQVKGSYATAVSVQRPRTLANVEAKLMEEAALSGSTFYYGWGAGKDRVEGPSVNLAMSAVRLWGNCAVELQPVQETRDAWIFTAAFVDLETGFTLSRQFRQAKNWVVHGRFDDARKDDIRFQIGQSKAIRNVVLNAVPTWLTNKAVERAKDGVREELESWIGKKGIESIRALLLKRLNEHGVTEAVALAKFGRSTPGGLTIEDMVVMRGDVEALKHGEDTVEHLYQPRISETLAAEGPKSDRLAEKMERRKAGPETPKEPESKDENPPFEPSTEPDEESQEPPAKQHPFDALAESIEGCDSEAALKAADAARKAASRKHTITSEESTKLLELIQLRRGQLEKETNQEGGYDDPFEGR